MAVRQSAIARQASLLNILDRDESRILTKKKLDSNNCLYAVAGFENGDEIIGELRSRYLNTKDRIYADIKADSNFSGQLYEYPNSNEKELLCLFSN